MKPACSDSNSLFTEGSLVEVSSDADGFHGVWYVAKVLGSPSFSSPPSAKRKIKKGCFFHIEYQTLLSDDSSKLLTELVESTFIRPLPPADNHDPQKHDVVDAFYLDGWWVGVVFEVHEESKSYSVYFEDPPELLHFKRSDLRVHWDWDGVKWVRPQKKEVFNGMECVGQSHIGCPDNPEETVTHENSCGAEKSAIERANCSAKSQMEWSSASRQQSGGKEMKQGRPSIDSTVSCPLKKLKMTINQKEGGTGSLKRKRGERKRSAFKGKKHGEDGDAVDKMVLNGHASIDFKFESPKNTEESNGKKHNGAGGAVDKLVMKDHVIICVESPKDTEESRGKECDGAGLAVDKMVIQDCANIDVKSPKTTGESTGSEDASVGKAAKLSDTGCSIREVEMGIVEKPSNMDTIAKPISMWFDGLCPQKIVVDSRFMRGRTVNQWNEAEGRLIEIAMECTANESVSDKMLPDENWCLPFVDTSSMFKAIFESIEVFQTMPQKPHFHPLKKCKEMYREGLAIAYMVTFANVVKQTSKLQVNDPKSIFNSISETLLDLELHGFDVKTIQNRLTELQLMKEREEQLQKESKEFECQITEYTLEQTKIMVEFDEVVEKMKMLEERKRRLTLMKEENDSKITELKLNVDVRNQDIQSVQLDFESLVAAPW